MRVALGVGLTLLGVFAATAARAITLVDSGELVLVAATFGVAHPPGFPLWVALAHLASHLPLGPVPFRVTLLSALAGAVVGTLAARLAERLAAGEEGGADGIGPPVPVGWWIGPSAGLAVGLSTTVWAYAVVAEVYTLNLALTAAVWLLLLGWRARETAGEPADRWLVAAALCYGLGLSVHHVTVGLQAPAIAYLGWRTVGWPGWRRISRGGAGIVAGLLPYGLLPLATASEPLLAWGRPDSWERFWWHLSGRQYRVYFEADHTAVVENLAMVGRLLLREWTLLGLALVVFGLLRLFRARHPWLGVTVLVAVPAIAYAAVYDIAEDADAYLLPTLLVLGVAIGPGLLELERQVRMRGRAAARAVAVAALLLPFASLALHWASSDRRDDRVGPRVVADTLAPVGAGGLVLTREWQLYAPFLTLHHLEGCRPDVAMIDVNLVRRSWYLEYLDRAYPERMEAVRREREAYARQLERFEHDRPYDPAVIQGRFVALLDALVADHLGRDRDVLVVPPLEPGTLAGLALVPQGLGYRVSRTPPLGLPEQPGLEVGHLLDPHLDAVAQAKIRPLYAEMLARRAGAELASGRPDRGRRLLAAAESLEPGLPIVVEIRRDLPR